ncbi:MAG: toxin-antitoxin system YwqK family antitoxin [Desulfovibrionaceae bacterium]
MKKLFYVLCLFLFMQEECFADKSTVVSSLIEKNGVYYNKNTGRPFTGTILKRINEGGRSFLLKMPYVKGRVHGEKEVLGSSDQILLRSTYVNAVQDGLTRQYYGNGAIKEQTYYKNNRKQGTSLFYYESGALWWELPYVDGVVHGIGRVYYEQGIVKQSSHFQNGLLDGLMQIYRDQGQLWLTFTYEEGRVVEGICYLSNGAKRALTTAEEETWNLQEKIYCP